MGLPVKCRRDPSQVTEMFKNGVVVMVCTTLENLLKTTALDNKNE